MSYKVVIGQ